MPPPSTSLPVLSVLPASPTPAFGRPTKRIRDGTDVARFLSSQAYRDIGLFVLQLNRAVVPRRSSPGRRRGADQGIRTWPLAAPPAEPCPSSRAIAALGRLLERVGALLADAPPDQGPRRFGNAAFRAWYALLEQHAPALFDELVRDSAAPHLTGVEANRQGADYIAARDEILAYLLGAFGSPQRLDYGTGHELSFLAFLGCLWKLGFFVPARPATRAETNPDDANPPSGPADMDADADADSVTETSRAIVLRVFEPYLATVRTLIQTYTLEPAGSHGVWGLDDHSFLPYIFGSAQLARPISADPGAAEPTPLEGSVDGAPPPVSVADAAAVERWRGLNMYFSAVAFIYDVKTGPFWEHSPMLYDISGVRDGWGKINKGMIKMFNAEVLSKFPVVQHFPFGTLFSWDLDPDAAPPVATTSSLHMASQPAAQPAFSLASGIGAPRLRSAVSRMPPPQRPPPPPPAMQAPGPAGTTAAQITITKAPWARDG